MGDCLIKVTALVGLTVLLKMVWSLSLFIMGVAIGNLLFYLLISDIVFLCFLFVYPIVDFSIV
jgi:hypothetical protein